MSDSPLVSVVIPTYNRADILADAINSVFAQTYDDIQVIVVDDGSTDDTSELVENFPEVMYHKQKNRGANAARNTGIELSNGEYVAFLDADDRWASEKIERQVDAFAAAGDDCGLIHTGIERQDFGNNLIDRVIPPDPKESKRRLLLGNYVGTFSTVMVRSGVFDKVGLLDEDLPSWQDWEFYLRVADEFGFARIKEPLTIKRTGKENQISRDLDTLVNTTYPIFESKIKTQAAPFGVLFRRKALARLRMEVGDAALSNNDISTARKFLFGGLRLYPFEPKLLAYSLVSLGGKNAYETALNIIRTGK